MCEHHPSGSLNSKEGPAIGALFGTQTHMWNSILPNGNWQQVLLSQRSPRHQEEPRHSTPCPKPRKKAPWECWEHAERTLELDRLENGTSAEACMTSKETRLEGKMRGRIQVQVLQEAQQAGGGSRDPGSRGLLSRRSILGFEEQLANQRKARSRLTVERFTARNKTGTASREVWRQPSLPPLPEFSSSLKICWKLSFQIMGVYSLFF